MWLKVTINNIDKWNENTMKKKITKNVAINL